MTDTTASRRSRHPRLVLIVLILVFSAPLLSAWILLNFTSVARTGNASHGDLYRPVRPLPDVALSDPLATQDAARRLHGDWSLLYLGPGNCDAACDRALYNMRQIRLAVGRYARHLQRVWLTDLEQPQTVRDALAHYEGTLVLPMNEFERHIDPEVFAMPPVTDPLRSDSLYVIDPGGNLVLRYRENVAVEGIIADLRRLLKGTRID